MLSEQAMTIATQCWCMPATSEIEMDIRLCEEFAKKIDEYLDALREVSECVNQHEQLIFVRIVEPLLKEMI